MGRGVLKWTPGGLGVPSRRHPGLQGCREGQGAPKLTPRAQEAQQGAWGCPGTVSCASREPCWRDRALPSPSVSHAGERCGGAGRGEEDGGSAERAGRWEPCRGGLGQPCAAGHSAPGAVSLGHVACVRAEGFCARRPPRPAGLCPRPCPAPYDVTEPFMMSALDLGHWHRPCTHSTWWCCWCCAGGAGATGCWWCWC